MATTTRDELMSKAHQKVPASGNFVDGVASKDATIDTETDTETGVWVRIFLPQSATEKKVPVVVYYLGGGFIAGSSDMSYVHGHCTSTAVTANVMVVAVSYRLAPEHRLPTAYEDSFSALLWLQKQAILQANGRGGGETWLIEHADFSQCFLMGESSGGNIVHHLAVRACSEDLSPLSLKGLIPIVPGFLTASPSTSEERYKNDPDFTTEGIDEVIRLALPVGASRAHPFLKVPFGPDAPNLAEANFPRMLVIVNKEDPIYDQQLQYVNGLKNIGKDVKLFEIEKGGHGYRLYSNEDMMRPQEETIADFITGRTAVTNPDSRE